MPKKLFWEGARRSPGLKEDTEGKGGCFPENLSGQTKFPCQMNIKRQSPFHKNYLYVSNAFTILYIRVLQLSTLKMQL